MHFPAIVQWEDAQLFTFEQDDFLANLFELGFLRNRITA
jgi:hypothetical protein